MSQVEMSIPMDSLRNLPSGAVYHKKSGQANASVATKGDTIIIVATCDSLQREVDYYENLYLSTKVKLDNLKETVQTEKERHSNPVKIAFVCLMAGFIVGIISTVIILTKFKNGKE